MCPILSYQNIATLTPVYSAVIASATDMYTDSTVSSHYQYNLV